MHIDLESKSPKREINNYRSSIYQNNTISIQMITLP